MDAADLWASRIAAAKRQYALHHSSLPGGDGRRLLDELEAEEEVRPDFPCPYCYEDYDIASLCSHLEDDHPSVNSRAAVCPICSVKVPRDLLNHIMLQHRRQRLRKVGVSSSQASSLLGYDLREAHLSVLLGGGGGGGGGGYRLSGINSSGTSVLINDSLLSTLVLNFASSEAEEVSKAFASSVDDFLRKSAISSQSWKSGFDSCTSSEEREVKIRQATMTKGTELLSCSSLINPKSLLPIEEYCHRHLRLRLHGKGCTSMGLVLKLFCRLGDIDESPLSDEWSFHWPC